MRVYTHPACLDHQPGAGHPECPARLEAVTGALRAAFPDLDWREAPQADRSALLRVHARELVARVLDRPVEGIVSELRYNRFVEWTHNGSQHGRHSSNLSAPLRSTHGRR